MLPGSGGWRQVLLRPGEHPALSWAARSTVSRLGEALAAALAGQRLVVAVDQLEELFTVCEHEEERAAFLEQLVAAASDAERRALVVVSLRADFYGRLASYSRFAELLSRSHVLVGPMDRDELARAIEQPAARAGLELEPGVADALVSDVAGEPGGCRCSPRRCLSCGGPATAACCAMRAIEPAVACAGRSPGWPKTRTTGLMSPSSGSRAG